MSRAVDIPVGAPAPLRSTSLADVIDRFAIFPTQRTALGAERIDAPPGWWFPLDGVHTDDPRHGQSGWALCASLRADVLERLRPYLDPARQPELHVTPPTDDLTAPAQLMLRHRGPRKIEVAVAILPRAAVDRVLEIAPREAAEDHMPHRRPSMRPG